MLALLFTLIVGISFYLGFVPLLIPVLYLLLSTITLLAYYKDKLAALNNEWRISETTLHFMALIGGWPGALIAQKAYRHKTRKTEFQIVFWLTLLANTGMLIWLHTAQGGNGIQETVIRLERLVMLEMDDSGLRNGILTLLSYNKL